MSPITYQHFESRVAAALAAYYRRLTSRIETGQTSCRPGGVFLFPSLLLLTKTETHYVFELLGARRESRDLVIRHNKRVKSVNRVVNGVDASASTVYMFGTGDPSIQTNASVVLEHLMLGSPDAVQTLDKRFPGLYDAVSQSALVTLGGPEINAIDVQTIRTLTIRDSILLSSADGVVRSRTPVLLFAESNLVDDNELVQDLEMCLADGDQYLGAALTTPEGSPEVRLAASRLLNLYQQDVMETTITSFLEAQGQIIRQAFDADLVFHQPSLPWRDGNTEKAEKSIQPDLIVKTRRGEWLVIDLKLPLLNKQRLTVGPRARRRLVQPIHEGIAQLGNYWDYFETPLNRLAAAELLGETIQMPGLVLIVGMDENTNKLEVHEALRTYRPVEIIDYDSLIRLHLLQLAQQPGSE